MRYDVFISYSQAADGLLSERVQSGLARFAKPWWRRRALSVFRDQTGLTANPGLWSSIADAIDNSRYFLLLASPEAAASTWVAREVAQWRAKHGSDGMLVVLTDGEIVWDDNANDFDWTASTALSALRARRCVRRSAALRRHALGALGRAARPQERPVSRSDRRTRRAGPGCRQGRARRRRRTAIPTQHATSLGSRRRAVVDDARGSCGIRRRFPSRDAAQSGQEERRGQPHPCTTPANSRRSPRRKLPTRISSERSGGRRSWTGRGGSPTSKRPLPRSKRSSPSSPG